MQNVLSNIARKVSDAKGTDTPIGKFAGKVTGYFGKAPSELHYVAATAYGAADERFLALFAGVDDAERAQNAAKAVQIIVAAHPTMQKVISPLRSEYVQRSAESIAAGSATLLANSVTDGIELRDDSREKVATVAGKVLPSSAPAKRAPAKRTPAKRTPAKAAE